MIRRTLRVLLTLLFFCVLACPAQEATRVVGIVVNIAADELAVRDTSGKTIQMEIAPNTVIRLVSTGAAVTARIGTAHDIGIGDRVLVNIRKMGESTNTAFSVNILNKAAATETQAAPPATSTPANAAGMNANQQDLEARAMARLGGTATSSAPSASGSDLESRALQAMQTNSQRAEQQRQQAEADAAASAAALAQAQAEAAASAPPPSPRSNGVADFLNGLSAAVGSATASMQQANQQRQEQMQQQQAQLAALRAQQAQLAALRQQQQAAAAARTQAQQATVHANASTVPSSTATASNNGSIYRYSPATSGTPGLPAKDTGNSGASTCVYLGPDLCVPNAKWQQILNAPTLYRAPDSTVLPDVTAPANYDVADGPDVHLCPKQGSVRVTYFLANDVGTSQDYPCHVGHQVILHWKQQPSFASGKGNGTGSSDSGNSAAGTAGTGTTAAPNPCVSGKWVQSPLYKTKQDLYLVSNCSADMSVSWFLGSNIGKAGAIHAFDTVPSSDGVYPGHDMSLSVYTCPMDHPKAVKANGDVVDGQRESYHCVANAYVPGFLESSK